MFQSTLNRCIAFHQYVSECVRRVHHAGQKPWYTGDIGTVSRLSECANAAPADTELRTLCYTPRKHSSLLQNGFSDGQLAAPLS